MIATTTPALESEHDIQVALFRWLANHPDIRTRMALTISNGARTGWRTAKKLQAEGVRPGVPDILLAISCGGKHGLWIEMKRPKSRKSRPVVSPEQQRWINALRDEGYMAEVCYGLEEAQKTINEYLALTPTETP